MIIIQAFLLIRVSFTMTKTILLLLLLIFVFQSCSFIVNNFKDEDKLENTIKPIYPTDKTTCDIIQKKIIVSENETSQVLFTEFIKILSPNMNLSFIDQVILWSFIQLNLRPDLSSPTAKLQTLIKIAGKDYYFNSYSTNNDGYPYLYLLDQIIVKFKNKKKLIDLAQLFDKYLPNSIYVSQALESFLLENQKELFKNPNLKKFYFRGNETLKKGERLPKIKMKELVKNYLSLQKKSNYQLGESLFNFEINKNTVSQCNFDISLYENSIFLINPEKIKSNIWGLKQDDMVFMATSSQKLESIKSVNGTFLISGNSNTRSSSVCMINNKDEKKQTTWLMSSESRDPGQHLFHLKQYGIFNLKSINELDNIMKFSRHQFLKDPVRLILESHRSSENQLKELLKLNIPIYNAKSLGKIWAYYENNQSQSFLIDERSQGHLECNSL